jgi:hypothetical protein
MNQHEISPYLPHSPYGSGVCLLHDELVKFTSDVIGGTGIGVPIVVVVTVRV